MGGARPHPPTLRQPVPRHLARLFTADVRGGTIGEPAGVPVNVHQWQWSCGFGTPAEYKAGNELAIARGLLWRHERGTFVKFTENGAELFA